MGKPKSILRPGDVRCAGIWTDKKNQYRGGPPLYAIGKGGFQKKRASFWGKCSGEIQLLLGGATRAQGSEVSWEGGVKGQVR